MFCLRTQSRRRRDSSRGAPKHCLVSSPAMFLMLLSLKSRDVTTPTLVYIIYTAYTIMYGYETYGTDGALCISTQGVSITLDSTYSASVPAITAVNDLLTFETSVSQEVLQVISRLHSSSCGSSDVVDFNLPGATDRQVVPILPSYRYRPPLQSRLHLWPSLLQIVSPPLAAAILTCRPIQLLRNRIRLLFGEVFPSR